MTVKLADAVKMPLKNKLKAARRMKSFDELPAEKLLKEWGRGVLRAETFVGAQVVDAKIQTPSSGFGRPSTIHETRGRKLCSAFSCCSN